MDYESGKAIPNNQVMGKIERALGEYIHVITCKKKILKNCYYLAITSGTSRHVFLPLLPIIICSSIYKP